MFKSCHQGKKTKEKSCLGSFSFLFVFYSNNMDGAGNVLIILWPVY